MGFLRYLLRKKKYPEFDFEKAAAEYLQQLPRCQKDVVIVSPEDHGEVHYKCEIIVAANDLLPWAERHAVGVWSSDQDDNTARQALPQWLFDAESSGRSYAPYFMHKVIRPYMSNFIQDDIISIFCPECQSIVADVKMEQLDRRSCANWSWWTDVWTCSQGHLLYHKEQELHIHYTH